MALLVRPSAASVLIRLGFGDPLPLPSQHDLPLQRAHRARIGSMSRPAAVDVSIPIERMRGDATLAWCGPARPVHAPPAGPACRAWWRPACPPPARRSGPPRGVPGRRSPRMTRAQRTGVRTLPPEDLSPELQGPQRGRGSRPWHGRSAWRGSCNLPHGSEAWMPVSRRRPPPYSCGSLWGHACRVTHGQAPAEQRQGCGPNFCTVQVPGPVRPARRCETHGSC